MKREKYKGFVIDARAVPLKSSRWSAQVNLEKHDGDSVSLTPFDIKGTYDSEESALESAVLHGRKVIDDLLRK